MTEFTEKFKSLIAPYVAQYAQKNRTIGRLARAWQSFEKDSSEEELKARLERLAAGWKKRTDLEIANYDSLDEYLANRRSEPRKLAWKIFIELGLYAPPTDEELEQLQTTAADDADDALQTVNPGIEQNFISKEKVVIDS